MVPVRIEFPHRGPKIVRVGGEAVIGRDPSCEVRLTYDSNVSRRHAVLRERDGELYLEELGSKNGTWVDGERVTGIVRLPKRSRVRLGTQLLTLTYPEESSQPGEEPIEPEPTIPQTAAPTLSDLGEDAADAEETQKVATELLERLVHDDDLDDS